jgi:hypothetical protein
MANASIVEFLGRNTRTITQIVDQTFFRLLEPMTLIDQIMPSTNYVARELLILKLVRHRPTVASIVAEEQEIPPSRPRAQLNEELLGVLNLGKKLEFKARDYELMYDLMRYAREAGARGAQMEAELKKHFFGLVADLIPPIYEKMTVLSLKIATTGSCVFTDPLTGARVDLSYDDTIANHFPAALAGNNVWTNVASTPLANLEKHARDYFNNLGMWPQRVVMRFSMLRNIADTTEAKVAWLRNNGNSADDPTGVYLSDEQVIDMVRRRTRCQSVDLLDIQYSEEQEDGTIVDKYFLEDNYYFFARDGFLERAFVPTVEKDFAGGVFLNSKVVEEAPRRERSVAMANGVPMVADPRYLAARKVA